jgi:3-hydroxybutyryl-CoA dehydrogenase
MTEIRQVGVIGAGTMGCGIAQAFAAAGISVIMRDVTMEALSKATTKIRGSLDRQAKNGALDAASVDATLARIAVTTDMAALAPCDLVVEAILEKFEVKAALIREIDTICAENAILASNTSSLSLTQLAAVSHHPGRVIGMHFFNPVPVMQLVEIIRALQTEDRVADAVISVAKRIGKTPHMAKDSYGFVVNRLLAPLINEAIGCVQEGVATPEDIDGMMKLGANHPMGPLALGDLIGLDVVLNVMETLHAGFGDSKYRPSPLLKQMVAAGYLGRKTGRGFFQYG